jgi:hypothetical protein
MKSKIQRQIEGTERDQARAARTPEQQIAALDRRLGKGVGARSERLRLMRQIWPGYSDDDLVLMIEGEAVVVA